MSQTSISLDELWRCPQCRSRLTRHGESMMCCNAECRLSYPIVDGIPVMLIDQSLQLSEDDWSAAVRQTAESRA
ncbi:Trm112 family protein [bacterium]|nr:Trm112 family protein [bacterium]